MSKCKKPRRNFRGWRALIYCEAGRDGEVLAQQLQRLGVTPIVFDAASEPPTSGVFDLVFVDVDSGRQSPEYGRLFRDVDRPVLAMIGSDAPSAVDWLIEQGACGYLVKPIRSTGILASLVIACHTFEERQANARAIGELRHRLKARQLVCTAALRLVDFFHIDEQEALRLLQVASMERRITVEDLAAMIVSGELCMPALGSDFKNRTLKVNEHQ